MVDKIVNKVYQTRNNWYSAFKSSIQIKGYKYYEIPGELRYRYPSPGSVAMDEVSYPHLYKKHWKISFKESPHNIRRKEVKVRQSENTEHVISGLVDWSDDKYLAGMQKPNTDDLTLVDKSKPLDGAEKLGELWGAFAEAKELR